MSEEKEMLVREWIAQWLDGTLSDDLAGKLLLHLQENEESLLWLQRNQVADFWLDSFYSPFHLFENEAFPNRTEIDIQQLLQEAVDYSFLAEPLPRPSVPETERSPGKTRRRQFFQAIGFMLLLFFIGWISIVRIKQEYSSSDKSFLSAVRVAEMVDVQWNEKAQVFRRGQESGANRFNIERGLLKLELNNGTEIVLEGPAEFTLIDPMHCFCGLGNFSVTIAPNGSGFEIATPFTKYIDRGTVFSLNVTKEGARLDVLKGMVDLVSSNLSTVTIPTGSSSYTNDKGDSKKGIANSDTFLSSHEFDIRLRQYVEKEKSIREQGNRNLYRNPNLLAHFDLGALKHGLCPNQSIRQERPIEPMSFSGYKFVEGSLFGDRAVRLLGKRSKFLLNVPGQYDSMTFSVCVRVDRLTNVANTILSSNSFYETGGINWHWTQQGILQFFLSPPKTQKIKGNKEGSGFETFSASIPLSKSETRVWIQVTVVLDAKEKRVQMFLDDRKIGESVWNGTIPIIPGELLLGNNINEKKSRNPLWFDGAIQDLWIYERALLPDEFLRVKTDLKN